MTEQREILFRGKRVDNGEWVYGLLWKKRPNNSRDIFISFYDDDNDSTKEERVFDLTIGQYTGLKDKNGKKIFEGDIVKFQRYVNASTDYDVGVIRFGNYKQFDNFKNIKHKHQGFYIEWFKDDIAKNMKKRSIDYENLEVIGNVHDNPELLEV